MTWKRIVSMQWILRGLVLCLALAGGTPALAGGLLWRISDPDGTLRGHLFGTVHLCDARCFPLDDAVREAFADARVLALELDPANEHMARALAAAGLLPAGERLDRRLSPALADRLKRAAIQAGADPASLLRMRPWLASSILAVMAASKAGFEAERGIDLWLAGEARSRGMPIVELETVERQIRALSAGGDRTHRAMLEQTVDLILDGRAEAYFGEVRGAWARGDAARLLEMVAEGVAQDDVQPLIDELVLARNREMAERMAELLASRDGVFIAIGAAHLGGTLSVVSELQRRGFELTPVP